MDYEDATDADIRGPITAYFRAISSAFAKAKSGYLSGIASNYPAISKRIVDAGLAKYSINYDYSINLDAIGPAEVNFCGSDYYLQFPDDANRLGAFQVKAGSPAPRGQPQLAPGQRP